MTEETRQIVKWKEKFLAYYEGTSDPEIQEMVACIKKRDRFYMMNCQLQYDYWQLDFPCFWDQDSRMYYFIEEKKRLYFAPNIDKLNAEHLIRCLKQEQDVNSPHRYLDDDDFDFIIKAKQSGKKIVVCEMGAMEGMFSLHLAELADAMYLFESSAMWVQALENTFRPWKDKVNIINKFVSDHTDSDNICLDDCTVGKVSVNDVFTDTSVCEEREYSRSSNCSDKHLLQNNLEDTLLVIKMDIEGHERYALEGMKHTLEKSQQFLMFACTYHRHDDESIFRNYFKGCNIRHTKGYFCFYVAPDYAEPYVRRCVLKINN